jgi:membrane protein
VTSHNHGALLSLGLLGALWTCSSAFATMIEALNVAYDVAETRTMWKTRLLAFELTFLIGFLVAFAFAFVIVGPHFGKFLAAHLGLSREFAVLWPLLQHVLAAILMVLALEGLYFLAPNIKHSFSDSLPGAVIAVIGWLLLSDGLSLYFQKFEHLNKTYGVLGGGIALLVWLYWSGFIVLVGAELNSEILQLRGQAQLPLRQPAIAAIRSQPATTADEPDPAT